MRIALVPVMIGAGMARRPIAEWSRGPTLQGHRLSAMFLVGDGPYLIYCSLCVGGLVIQNWRSLPDKAHQAVGSRHAASLHVFAAQSGCRNWWRFFATNYFTN